MNPSLGKYFKNQKFIELFASLIEKFQEEKNTRKGTYKKYTSLDYAKEIINVLVSSSSWRSYQGLINGRVLNNKHNSLINMGVYDKLYEICSDSYFSINTFEKYKYQSIDCSFIPNKGCISEEVGRNGFYKSKKGIKISTIVDSKGIPLGKPVLATGNRHDVALVDDTLNNITRKLNTYNVRNNNRYKQTFMADKGYCSKNLQTKLKKKGHKVLILGKKNSKNKKFSKKEMETYSKRTIVENFFSWVKRYPKINCIYEKSTKSYNGLLLLSISRLMINRIS